jgi:hypothetical protein
MFMLDPALIIAFDAASIWQSYKAVEEDGWLRAIAITPKKIPTEQGTTG